MALLSNITPELERAIMIYAERNSIEFAKDDEFLGTTRKDIERLEIGDVFVFHKKHISINEALTKGEKPTAPKGTPEYEEQLKNYKPAAYLLVQVLENSEHPERKGLICALYLSSIDGKTVYQYVRNSDGDIINTGNRITSAGNITPIIQKYHNQGRETWLNELHGHRAKVTNIFSTQTLKYGLTLKTAQNLSDGDAFRTGHCFAIDLID